MDFHFHLCRNCPDIYASYGSLVLALNVQRNSVTKNFMITGLVKWGELELARSLFDQMSEPTVCCILDCHY
ncbi:hypothetical protein C1H46_013757 [Malus baccata]|uniref:Pentatricopeptide repeat-containing protein n=1 Tax=Malus baccata TaxID=106549 RepID=A0A540MQI7_MALBA|nr:hypothetical protein C1H46_013757 [Malus baccata]